MRAAQLGTDDRRDGLVGWQAAWCSTRGPKALLRRKAVEVLGLGSASIRWCPPAGSPVRPDNSSAWYWLTRRPGTRGRGGGHRGHPTTGAIDPLGQIASVCARYGLWLHVDGAYGAPPILLLDRYQTARDGLARADSLAVDAHKWLYAPVDAGLVLLRDGAVARDTFSLVPAYLRTDGDEDGPGGPVWFSEYGKL
jgi:hypothetical protein